MPALQEPSPASISTGPAHAAVSAWAFSGAMQGIAEMHRFTHGGHRANGKKPDFWASGMHWH
jgi:hypothetical protein